jgi:hypothetical protein
MTLIGDSSAEHLRFWRQLVCVCVGLAIGYFLDISIQGDSVARLPDMIFGAGLGYFFGWHNGRAIRCPTTGGIRER